MKKLVVDGMVFKGEHEERFSFLLEKHDDTFDLLAEMAGKDIALTFDGMTSVVFIDTVRMDIKKGKEVVRIDYRMLM